MKFEPEKLFRWVERRGIAFLEWDDRRTKARQEKMLKDHHTLEFSMGLCVLLLIFGLVNHASRAYLHALIALALFIAVMKLWQLAIIAMRGKREDGK